MSEFHFIRPYWLFAFLPLILLVFLNLRQKLQQGSWQAVCDADLLPFILQEKERQQSRLPFISSLLAAVLAIVALAGPTWERLPAPVYRNSAALVIALDLSRSMDATDIKPSRLSRARYKIADLLNQRKDGQTALLVYAQTAFTVTPLTNDIETIKSQLKALSTDIMPAQGSNSTLAIDKAIQLLKNAGLQQGQILLVTDDQHIEQAMDNVDKAPAYQVSILAVGTAVGAPIPVSGGGFLKDQAGNIVLPKLAIHAAQKAAKMGGGIYQQITNTDADINRLSHYFDRSNQAEAKAENDLLLENWSEAGVWLLLPLLGLAVLSFRRGLLGLVFIVLLPLPKESYALEWQDLWQTQQQQAYQNYLQGNYQQAAKQFTDPAWQAAAKYKTSKPVKEEDLLTAKTETGFYNQGNVLAKSGQFEKALEAYNQALKINPNNKDAQFNKELVEKALDKQKQQKNQQQQSSDKRQDSKDKQDKGEQQSDKQQDQQQESEGQQGEDTQASEKQTPKESENQDNKNEGQQEQPSKESKENTQPNKLQQDKDPTAKSEKEREESEQQTAAANDERIKKNEQQQANEQWLKRIPDDPSGLLRRKFLYQYSRQKQRSNTKQQW